ncbi:HAD hydrolase-like protein, partial [bacterium]|nr:HAD hydrolase-like protein [bacterium]
MRYKHIIFDFDGVLVESNSIRFEGFRRLFNKFSENNIEQFLKYVILNGGLSRYEKIGYFFEKIRHEVISPDNVLILAERYSGIVKQKV